MKIEKTNGLYRKPRLRVISRVPLLIWLPLVLAISSVLVALSLSTWLENNAEIANQPVVRKSSWRVAVVGDIACAPDSANYNSGEGVVNACQMKAVGEALEKENLDAVLLVGDIQYSIGKFEDFERSFVSYFRDITVPIYAVPGNHDYGNGTVAAGDLSGYKKAFAQYMPNVKYEAEGRTYYDFNLGPWKLYALDSNCVYVGGCGIGSDQYNWLTSKLTIDKSICSIAFWHHPLFTSGVHKSDADILDRKDFWTVLDSSGADIILNGHDHTYERFATMTASGNVDQNGVREFIVGTGGYDLRAAPEQMAENSEKFIGDKFGYLYLELFTGRYDWQFKAVDGMVRDSGSDGCR